MSSLSQSANATGLTSTTSSTYFSWETFINTFQYQYQEQYQTQSQKDKDDDKDDDHDDDDHDDGGGHDDDDDHGGGGNPQDPQKVPEPSSILGLLFVGACVLAKKQLG
jgi:hypothetical protein